MQHKIFTTIFFYSIQIAIFFFAPIFLDVIIREFFFHPSFQTKLNQNVEKVLDFLFILFCTVANNERSKSSNPIVFTCYIFLCV